MKHYIAIPVILGLFLLGCGPSEPKMHPVTGAVTYRGEPLPLGIVMFVPKAGPPSKPSLIDQHGRYQLEAVAGEHCVGVVAMPPRKGGRPDPSIEGGVDYTGVPKVESLIPIKYNRHDTSGITVVVEPGKRNEINIYVE